MSLVLNNLRECPPGYFRYLVPETGRRFPDPELDRGKHYLSLTDLLNDLTSHYIANGFLVPSNLSILVQDQLCRLLPPEICRYDNPGHQPVTRFHITPEQMISGTKSLVSWQLNGREKVPIETSNDRSAICIRCPLNVQPSGCATCNNPLHAIVNSFVGSRQGAYDNKIYACAICGCSLKALVQMPQETINEHLSQEQKESLPEYCWQK
jgi:hypothetical protein